MTPDLRDLIAHMLAKHWIMALATNRSDGWPRANMMAYGSEGLILYCLIAQEDQAFTNILRDPRVSVAIGGGSLTAGELKGLSLSGKATVVDCENDYQRTRALLMERCPEHTTWPPADPALAPVVRIVPEFISLLDDPKGVGHSDPIPVIACDLDNRLQTRARALSRSGVVRAVRPSGSRFAPLYVRGQTE